MISSKSKMYSRMVIFLLLVNICCISWVHSEPLVEIFQGKLNGIIQQTRTGREFSSFYGIPYAEPPINDLRFRSPVPAKSWEGIRMAVQEGNECPQVNETKIIGDEDCLYLNVYTPLKNFDSSSINETSNNLLPVMVWIHGGAFIGGSSSTKYFHPGYLMEKDIVLVSMNYRLGILGFLSTGNSVAPGNFGMKDQVLALKWVQKNIRAFGGDPKKVTIFGESAGGASVSLHAFSNASKGLFHQYIAQSGSALDPWAYQSKAYFKPYVAQLATVLGCPIISSNIVVECLREKSASQLVGTSSVFGRLARFAQLTWTPTDEEESEDAFLTDSPANLIAQNKVQDLPLIVGNVVNEGLLITQAMYSVQAAYDLVRLSLDVVLNYFSSYYLKPKNVLTFTHEIKRFYFKKWIFSSKKEFIQGVTKFITDGFFLYPEKKLADTITQKLKEPVYFYNFGYQGSQESKNSLVKNYEDAMVGHAHELQYLFPQNSTTLRGTDANTSNLMVDLWTSFAINGKPTSNLLQNPNIWTPYKDNTSYLQIGGSTLDSSPIVSLEHSYFPDRMEFWETHCNL